MCFLKAMHNVSCARPLRERLTRDWDVSAVRWCTIYMEGVHCMQMHTASYTARWGGARTSKTEHRAVNGTLSQDTADTTQVDKDCVRPTL